MDKQRRDIIINEIRYWQKSKLLPEQQCHFLLALYSEGEDTLPDKDRKPMIRMIFWLLLTQLSFLISVFILYFTDIVSVMQMALVILCVCITGLAWYIRRNNAYEPVLYLMTLTLILFISCLKFSMLYWQGSSIWLVSSIFIVIWLIIGKVCKKQIFNVLAGFVLILLLGLLFFYR